LRSAQRSFFFLGEVGVPEMEPRVSYILNTLYH
jgi:hypothetical protein